MYIKENGRLVWLGCVYIIKCNSFYKIGRTGKNPKYRLSDLQIGNPYKLKFTRQMYCKDTKGVEKQLHTMFSNQRVTGEWFKLTTEDLLIIDNLITTHE